MKITALLLLVALFQLSAKNAYSQKGKISMNMEDATIESIFNEIEKQTDFNILYKNSTLDTNRKVTVKADKVKIEDLMDLILKETNVSFEIRRKLIVLLEKKMVPRTEIKTSSLDPPKIKQQTMTVTGMVTDQQNVPLGGVSIVIRGTTKGVSTNLTDNMKLRLQKGTFLYSLTSVSPNMRYK